MAGFRSGLEEVTAAALDRLGIDYAYEQVTVPFLEPAKPRKYTPDFVLLHNGIVVETKGRFVTADRAKLILVKAQHPDLDLRLVFSNSRTRISKTSLTTYGAWADHKGFPYADKTIPDAWLKEPPNTRSLAAIRQLLALQEKKRK